MEELAITNSNYYLADFQPLADFQALTGFLGAGGFNSAVKNDVGPLVVTAENELAGPAEGIIFAFLPKTMRSKISV